MASGDSFLRIAAVAAWLLAVVNLPAFAQADLSPGMNSSLGWKALPSIPDREGFAGPFAGVSGGTLIVAGGANFPDKRPWESGKKIWYDSVFVLEKTDGAWKTGLKLPRPLAYGVSATAPGGVVCAGGGDAERHYAYVFLLKYASGKLTRGPLPSLPLPCANASGAILGDTLYLAGGSETPGSTRALKTFWALDLSRRGAQWKELERSPARLSRRRASPWRS
jgi:N-acetylneuraminic acid mutarotase